MTDREKAVKETHKNRVADRNINREIIEYRKEKSH